LISNRNVLITGGSRGLGEAIATEFWNSGANLMLVARSLESLEAVRDRLVLSARPGQRIVCLSADLADPATPAAIVHAFRQNFDRLDVLVNNAAILGPIGRFWDNGSDAWTGAMQVNLLSPAELMRGAIPWMASTGGGSIINVSGGGATMPRVNFSAYGAAKAALVRLSETVALEAEPLGVRVFSVAPGPMNTNMLETVLNASPDAVGPEYARAVQQKKNGGTNPAIPARLCLRLTGESAQPVNGRLLSAIWDPWEKMDEWAAGLAGTDIYTIRRIVPADRGKELQ